jgi:hypothetical protein
MEKGVLRSIIPANSGFIYYGDARSWNEDIFYKYDKFEYIEKYYKPINRQRKRIEYLSNQIQLHNLFVKTYSNLKVWLKDSKHNISNLQNNMCIKLSKEVKDLNDACA